MLMLIFDIAQNWIEQKWNVISTSFLSKLNSSLVFKYRTYLNELTNTKKYSISLNNLFQYIYPLSALLRSLTFFYVHNSQFLNYIYNVCCRLRARIISYTKYINYSSSYNINQSIMS